MLFLPVALVDVWLQCELPGFREGENPFCLILQEAGAGGAAAEDTSASSPQVLQIKNRRKDRATNQLTKLKVSKVDGGYLVENLFLVHQKLVRRGAAEQGLAGPTSGDVEGGRAGKQVSQLTAKLLVSVTSSAPGNLGDGAGTSGAAVGGSGDHAADAGPHMERADGPLVRVLSGAPEKLQLLPSTDEAALLHRPTTQANRCKVRYLRGLMLVSIAGSPAAGLYNSFSCSYLGLLSILSLTAAGSKNT